ncbi:Pectinesterase [Mycena sanguinolenta]|uniref:pectinesterase n=1 Tax=Mycena sanguinolenta TaxID=230812 RepID=A0A8H7DCD8_9AGAR|nr:Pectinesterase [Mycena sanguinolenta]
MAKLSIFFSFLPLLQYALAASRTTPPSGAIVVRAGTTTAGEFSTLSAALASLPNDDSSQSIFIFPGTYTGQNDITREGPLTVYLWLHDRHHDLHRHQAILTAGVSAATAGSDDASGTLHIHKNNFKMYNVNFKNTFGPGSQAIAIAQYGSQVGLYACGFFGYQDTLYANQGNAGVPQGVY